MIYLSISSASKKVIEYAEEYKDEADARYRFSQLYLECQARGGDWLPYSGDKPFEWPVDNPT